MVEERNVPDSDDILGRMRLGHGRQRLQILAKWRWCLCLGGLLGVREIVIRSAD